MRVLPLFLPALIAALVAALSVPVATGRAAAAWLEPDAAYSAVRVMRSGEMEMRGPVHHDDGKERWEIATQGMRQVMIRRPDQQRMLMMMPDMNMGMWLDLSQTQQMSSAEHYVDRQPEALGREAQGGEMTTKYRLVEDTERGSYTILFWVTDDGIPLRIEGSSEQGGFEMELSDLKRGPQDPSLFEPPDGLQLMPANPAMMGPMMGGGQ
ncbi:MAG: hypothetical protein ACFCUQ_00780 [Kiloniellales bacterium]